MLCSNDLTLRTCVRTSIARPQGKRRHHRLHVKLNVVPLRLMSMHILVHESDVIRGNDAGGAWIVRSRGRRVHDARKDYETTTEHV